MEQGRDEDTANWFTDGYKLAFSAETIKERNFLEKIPGVYACAAD